MINSNLEASRSLNERASSNHTNTASLTAGLGAQIEQLTKDLGAFVAAPTTALAAQFMQDCGHLHEIAKAIHSSTHHERGGL